MGRLRRASLVMVGLLILTTVVVGVAAEQTRPLPSDETCVPKTYAVYESAENPSEVRDEAVRYEDMTPAQQRLFREALASEGERVDLNATQRRLIDRSDWGGGSFGDVIVYEGTVYRASWRGECQLIAHVPVVLNPYLQPFVFLYVLLSGPLLPLVVLVVAGGVAYAVGTWAEY